MEVVGLVVGIPILLLGIVIANRVFSLTFFDDTGTVKMIKSFTLLAYFGGLGAAFVGKVIFGAIGIAMAIVGYWVLIRVEE